MREKEEAKLGLHSSRNRHWSVVKIRIRFSDRTLLEGEFTESDTIDKVYSFLEDALDEKSKGKGLVIYTTPPKIEYKRKDNKAKGKTLRELGLIPSAVVNLRWDQQEMNSNTFPAPIKPELKELAQSLPPPPSFDQQPLTVASAGGSEAGREQGKKAMPKWLKGIVSKSLYPPSYLGTIIRRPSMLTLSCDSS